MRATKGFLSALGAGGSLVAAAAVALLIVSAIVAQRGWPGVASPLSSSQVVAGTAAAGPGGSTLASAGAVPTVRVNLGGAPRAARRAAAPGAARSRGFSPTGRSHQGRAVSGHSANRSSSVAATGVVGRAPAAASSPSSQPAPSGGATLGKNVQSASSSAGSTVAPASPVAGDVVNRLGSTAGGATDQTTTTASGIIHGGP